MREDYYIIFLKIILSVFQSGKQYLCGLATAVSAAETGSLTEATFTNYARQQVAAADWTTIGADSTDTQTAKNTNAISFPASGGTNNTILMCLSQMQQVVVTYCL